MALLMLAGYQPGTQNLEGYRFRNRIVSLHERATCYMSPSAARKAAESAAKRWPHLEWRPMPWRSRAERAEGLPAPRKAMFTRAEAWELILKEREGCAALCESEERIRTQAGHQHPEESPSRDRCFAGARAAINCALGIRSERPRSLEEFGA